MENVRKHRVIKLGTKKPSRNYWLSKPNNHTTKNWQVIRKNKPAVDSLRENHKEFIKNNKLILKSQQRFRSEKHNTFAEEVSNIALSANDDKRIE